MSGPSDLRQRRRDPETGRAAGRWVRCALRALAPEVQAGREQVRRRLRGLGPTLIEHAAWEQREERLAASSTTLALVRGEATTLDVEIDPGAPAPDEERAALDEAVSSLDSLAELRGRRWEVRLRGVLQTSLWDPVTVLDVRSGLDRRRIHAWGAWEIHGRTALSAAILDDDASLCWRGDDGALLRPSPLPRA